MLYDHLIAGTGSQPAIITAEDRTSWLELGSLTEHCADELASHANQRVGLRLQANAHGIAMLGALEHLGCHVFLFDARAPDVEVEPLAARLGLATVLSAGSPPTCLSVTESQDRHVVPGGVTVLTSGTEGVPKAVVHTWETLSKPVRVTEPGQRQIWALCYRIQLYAGLQVLLQALLNHGTLVIPALEDDPTEIARLLATHRVGFVSATPSYVRRLLLFCDRDTLSSVPLVQVTMGGEVVDQNVLDGVKSVFPQARIVHIYATSELGRCFSVTDGREGFPKSLLQGDESQAIQLRVVDNELQVKSTNSMIGYDRAETDENSTNSAGWRATGDLVVETEDRILFTGRQGDMINVGGNKVHPVQVERVLRQVAGVSDVRVFGHRSSLAGELVACEIVVTEGVDRKSTREAVAQECAASLNRYQIPRIVNFVEQIETSAAGKVARHNH